MSDPGDIDPNSLDDPATIQDLEQETEPGLDAEFDPEAPLDPVDSDELDEEAAESFEGGPSHATY